LKDFAHTIKSVVHGSSPIQYLAAVEDDPQKRKPDISRAKKYLDWEPQASLGQSRKERVSFCNSKIYGLVAHSSFEQ